MWTYQEARLASRVKILTAAGPVDLHETIKFLEKLEKIKKFDKENPLGTANTSLLPRSDTRNIAGLLEQLQAIFGPGKVTLADVWRAGMYSKVSYLLMGHRILALCYVQSYFQANIV